MRTVSFIKMTCFLIPLALVSGCKSQEAGEVNLGGLSGGQGLHWNPADKGGLLGQDFRRAGQEKKRQGRMTDRAKGKQKLQDSEITFAPEACVRKKHLFLLKNM